MALEVKLLDEAEADYHKIIDWYETQQPGLGMQFFFLMNELFQKLKLHPSNYGYYYKSYRHTILKGFPYRVVLKLKTIQFVCSLFFIQVEAQKNFAND